jgi:tetratricopeptide (TPR) repeat protein
LTSIRRTKHRVPQHVSAPDHPFTGEHVALAGRLSVLARRDARRLIERLGGTVSAEVTPQTTVVVAGADADLPDGHAARLLTEADLCRLAGLPDLETLRTQYHSIRDLRSRHDSLRDDHLRYLERWGLVRPIAGRYSFADIAIIRHAAAAIERGTPLNAVLRTLAAQRQGQLAFDFQTTRVDATPARVVALPSRQAAAPRLPGMRDDDLAVANRRLAATHFLEGAELDDGDQRDLDAAAAAYRRAARLDPQLVPALVNLANIHYERDQLVEAEALYERAIRLDAECFEAYFNLGNIHHDLGRFAEAVSCYREALAINPMYPEAHFYLAVTLEKMSRSSEARPHWREYRRLAPEGEFVELAKEFCD